MLDLRHISLGQARIAAFPLKRDALAFAHAQGWRSHDVIAACNRFSRFYVVGQAFGGPYRLLRDDGTVCDLTEFAHTEPNGDARLGDGGIDYPDDDD